MNYAYERLNRILSLIATSYILYYELMCSRANWTILLGVSIPNPIGNPYESHYISNFLSTLMQHSNQVQTNLTGMNHTKNSIPIIYLDSLDGQIGLQNTFCTTPTRADYLYTAPVLHSILHSALAAWQSNYSWILVDCSFDGRTFEDTTMLKIHLLDENVTVLSTLVLQTLSISRPRKRKYTTGGAITVMSTNLSTLQINPNGVITSKFPAVYWTALGFSFPYENDPFEYIIHGPPDPKTAEWHGYIAATGEEVSFSGTTGMYRKYPDVQCSGSTYNWELPSSPVQYIQEVIYRNVYNIRDSWSWFRLFLGLGIGFNLIINMAVASLVMFNIWRRDRTLWLPDLYPSIQRRAVVRTGLLISSCFATNWWYLFEASMRQAMLRSPFLNGILLMEELVVCDTLMGLLASMYLVARLLKIRISFHFVVFVFIACFRCRQQIIKSAGLYLDETNALVMSFYYENIQPGNGGMDLWTRHENVTTNFIVILTESTWLLITFSICFVYALYIKFCHRRKTSPSVNQVMCLNNVNMSSKSNTQSSVQLSRQSSLCDIPVVHHGNTLVERVLGSLVREKFGFVASNTKDYCLIHSQIHLTPSALWLMGYVIIDDKLVLAIHDYIFLVLNSLTKSSYFRLYGLHLCGTKVSKYKHWIDSDEVDNLRVWNVTLTPLE